MLGFGPAWPRILTGVESRYFSSFDRAGGNEDGFTGRYSSLYELPGGDMAVVTHKGPYEKSAVTYKRLFAWIAENHKRVTGPTREVYLNDPAKVTPEELLTEIYAPVA